MGTRPPPKKKHSRRLAFFFSATDIQEQKCARPTLKKQVFVFPYAAHAKTKVHATCAKITKARDLRVLPPLDPRPPLHAPVVRRCVPRLSRPTPVSQASAHLWGHAVEAVGWRDPYRSIACLIILYEAWAYKVLVDVCLAGSIAVLAALWFATPTVHPAEAVQHALSALAALNAVLTTLQSCCVFLMPVPLALGGLSLTPRPPRHASPRGTRPPPHACPRGGLQWTSLLLCFQ